MEHSLTRTPTAPRHARKHVAIVLPAYLERIASGEKYIESRLTRTRREPWGLVRPRDVVYFVGKGGIGCVRCIVSRVESHEQLDRQDVLDLRDRYNHAVRGTHAYWLAKMHSRYATLLWLACPQAQARVPDYRQAPGWTPGRAWFVLAPRTRAAG